MVFEVNPLREAENVPKPVPLLVFVLNETVGLGNVDQTTPLAVIGAPPSEVTFPPLTAVFDVILEELVVLIVG